VWIGNNSRLVPIRCTIQMYPLSDLHWQCLKVTSNGMKVIDIAFNNNHHTPTDRTRRWCAGSVG
jgi:hypothetical protein